jgi:hypothetical protein
MIDLRGDETTSLQAFDRGIPSGTTAQGCLVEYRTRLFPVTSGRARGGAQ